VRGPASRRLHARRHSRARAPPPSSLCRRTPKLTAAPLVPRTPAHAGNAGAGPSGRLEPAQRGWALLPGWALAGGLLPPLPLPSPFAPGGGLAIRLPQAPGLERLEEGAPEEAGPDGQAAPPPLLCIKRTFQPHVKRRKRKHGFLGRRVAARAAAPPLTGRC